MKPINAVVFRVLVAGLLATSMVGFGTTSAGAAVVYDQRPPSFVSASGSATYTNALVATSVSLATAINFNKVVWSVRHGSTLTNPNLDFDIVVYADSAGLPDTELARDSVLVDASGAPVIGNVNNSDVYELEAVLNHPVALAAGNYWISIQQTDSTDPALSWTFDYIATSPIAQAVKPNSFDPWFITFAGRVHDLQLQNVSSNTQTIPSPAGLGAVALAALTLLAPHRKRRSR